jgi:hypothetical protein
VDDMMCFPFRKQLAKMQAGTSNFRLGRVTQIYCDM